jgi:hypothetical protein
MRDNASSKRASGEGSKAVKSTTSIGLLIPISQRNCPEQRGQMISDGSVVAILTI